MHILRVYGESVGVKTATTKVASPTRTGINIINHLKVLLRDCVVFNN